MRALYGLRPIEEHRDAGDQVRRVFYVDGYGRDVIAIAFVRTSGHEPIVRVYFPGREGGAAREPLEAPVPQSTWDDLIFRSAMFERQLVPVPIPDNVIPICMHSWVYTVEASDPAPSPYQPAAVRRATQDSCGSSLSEAFAIEAQRAALPLFPACNRLDPEQHRNPASQLAACRLLRGDRMAAAAVMNDSRAFRQVRSVDDVREIASRFADGATIDWQGERNQGRSSAAVFWARKVGEAHGANIYTLAVEGISATRVRMVAWLHRSVEAMQEQHSTDCCARVEMIWVFGPAQQFQVESVTVGPWQATSPR